MNTANSSNGQATQAEQTYQQALAANAQAQQATMAVNCTEQVCPFVCQPGVNCTTCYQETQLVEQGSCTKYKGVSKNFTTEETGFKNSLGIQKSMQPMFCCTTIWFLLLCYKNTVLQNIVCDYD